MKQKVEIEVDVPNGFKAVGIRTPKKGDYFIDPILDKPVVGHANYDWTHSACVILEEVPREFWINVCTKKRGGYVYMTEEAAKKNAGNYGVIIHVKEVIK